ncbi:SMI1/KNR4 family protein [Chryseobacterium indologenes]|uniref:SMI1/KNR4 family protein n=1 Tax=Chryseobacterium indologenes TaxID=253 RepID=UPI000B51ABFB|nr:SMI1/KNR4 family protein [Chryseobacterium indologenes]ASE60799.1 SMI1/KNR4 family protein [Chryseobacterium indologenes]VFA40271.1 SMI1 / KNR4 family [Chryseobacterium indologenes]
MSIHFEKTSAKITIDDIQSFEKSLKIKLPEDFKEHYLKYNGGIPDNKCFYMQAFDTFVEISRFFSIKNVDEKGQKIEDVYTNLAIKQDILQPHYLPFAKDWGGNLFCINLKLNDIFILYLDMGVVEKGSIRFLTRGFENFIEMLEKCEDEEDED